MCSSLATNCAPAAGGANGDRALDFRLEAQGYRLGRNQRRHGDQHPELR